MEISSLPYPKDYIKDFLEENRSTWRKYKKNLVSFVGLTFCVWVLEGVLRLAGLYNLTILGGLPAHYLPEWVALGYLGRFTAELKKTLIPTEVMVSVMSLSMIFLSATILGFSILDLFLTSVFVSFFLLGYLSVKFGIIRKC